MWLTSLNTLQLIKHALFRWYKHSLYEITLEIKREVELIVSSLKVSSYISFEKNKSGSPTYISKLLSSPNLPPGGRWCNYVLLLGSNSYTYSWAYSYHYGLIVITL